MIKFSFTLSSFLPLATVAALAFPPARVDAQLLLDETFESYPADVSLDGRNPGDGNPSNWIIQSEVSGQQGALAVEGSSMEGSGANQRIARFFDTSGAAPFPTMRRSFTPTDARIETVFKIRIDDAAAGTHQVILSSISQGTARTAARFRFSPTTFSLLGKSEFPGGPQNNLENFFTSVVVGDWYEVNLTADPATGTFWASIRNLDKDDPAQSASSERTHYFWSADTSVIDRWGIEQATTTRIGASLDDIIVRVLADDGDPEPLQVEILPVTTGGFFRMNVFGTPDRSFAIDASADLMNWDEVVANAVIDQTGLYEFTDTESNGLERRFYRVRTD